jgi:hypothetical protein
MSISKRDQTKYELAIVELNERINRIINETGKLNSAIVEIGSFGLDYEAMTEKQQYVLGSYVNLMFSSSQLLINPIMGLQPNYSDDDLDKYLSSNLVDVQYRLKKKLLVYLANLLYNIETDETDRKLLAKSFRGNKKFIKDMEFEKKDFDLNLFNVVNEILSVAYKK